MELILELSVDHGKLFNKVITNSFMENLQIDILTFKIHNTKLIKKFIYIILLIVVGLFCNCRLDCLLPHYGPMVLGRRVKTSLTATQPKPACVQARAHLLRP